MPTIPAFAAIETPPAVGRMSTGGRHSPLFTHIFVAHDLDRAPRRTQLALMEAMVTRRVVFTGETQAVALPEPFIVIGTADADSVTLLPEMAERFMLSLDYDFRLSCILTSHHPEPLFSLREVRALQALASNVHTSNDVLRYIRDIVVSLRKQQAIRISPAPMGSVAFIEAVKCLAILNGMAFATPAHVREMAGPALAHRIQLYDDFRVTTRSRAVIDAVLGSVSAPV